MNNALQTAHTFLLNSTINPELQNGNQCNCMILEAVLLAVKTLEDHPVTNAGIGSNLTFDGHVECDASVMTSDQHFGSVGAVRGVYNPILLAGEILKDSYTPLSHGRLSPLLLVGEGARQWGINKQVPGISELPSVDPTFLVTEQSKATWNYYLSKLQSSNQPPLKKQKKTKNDNSTSDPSLLYDTVGAVGLCTHGFIVSAVSSGGILLKSSGRVGEAGVYSCGCYTHQATDTKIGIGCSVTGEGEKIIKSLFAKKISKIIIKKGEERAVSLIKRFGGKVGFIALTFDKDEKDIELLWGFNTRSMGIGYITSQNKSKVMISYLEETSKHAFTSAHFKL